MSICLLVALSECSSLFYLSLCDCLSVCGCLWVNVSEEKSYRRGRLSTVDLLVPTSLDQLLSKWKIVCIYLQNEEVNCTKPSPSVSIPWSVCVCVFVCVCACVCDGLGLGLSICLPVCPSTRLSVCLFVTPSACLSVHLIDI